MNKLARKMVSIVAACAIGVTLWSGTGTVISKASSDSGKLVSGSTKTSSRTNPLMDHKFGADPCAMTYNGRVYVYMTNDSQQYDTTSKDYRGYPTAENNFGNIATVTVISSSDLVNWVDHGEILVAGRNASKDPNGIAKWANNS